MKKIPHIFFNSALDSASDWRHWLSAELGQVIFSVEQDLYDKSDVDVALLWTYPKHGLDQMTGLRAILSLGAGVDQLMLGSLPIDVPLARLVDASLTQHMVEYAKACVFRYHRRLHVFEKNSRERLWQWSPPKLTSASVVGILGLGQLGQAIALALAQEGFNVHGWSTTPKQFHGVTTHVGMEGLNNLMAASDIVINVLPLTDTTRFILSKSLFKRARKPICLINMGRGDHLVEADLLDALDAGSVQAATLDVVSVEPLPIEHSFWSHPDILITPHVAGLPSPRSAVSQVAENIRRAMLGKPLVNAVHATRGY